MPKWGIEMVEGTIAEWRIAAGDQIKKGQILALIETDKIANDLECELDATVARVVAAAGSVYPVFTGFISGCRGSSTYVNERRFLFPKTFTRSKANSCVRCLLLIRIPKRKSKRK